MKHVILLGDGMADFPIDVLGGKTPLEYAHTPHMDRMAAEGTLGLIDTMWLIWRFSVTIPGAVIPVGALWRPPIWG